MYAYGLKVFRLFRLDHRINSSGVPTPWLADMFGLVFVGLHLELLG